MTFCIKDHVKRVILTDEQINNVIDLYRNGNSIRQVAKEIGLSFTKVRNTLIENKVRLREEGMTEGPKFVLPRDEGYLEKLENMYQDGISIKNIAKAHKHSYYGTRTLLLNHNVRLRNHETVVLTKDKKEMVKRQTRLLTDTDIAEMEYMIMNEGYTIHQAADKFNVSVYVAKRALTVFMKKRDVVNRLEVIDDSYQEGDED